MEGNLARCIRAHIQTSRLRSTRRWEVNPVEMGMGPMGKKAGNFIPVYPLIRSRTVGNPMVR